LLDPITPQYIADLLSWAAIGARTTESQTHRQMASGLSMPVGFKNATSGNVKTAANAIVAASREQTFLGIDRDGKASAVTTSGNPDCHLILRGGENGPNYDADSIHSAYDTLQNSSIPTHIMVDCSHANSDKQPELQPLVAKDVVRQIVEGNESVIGLMLESHLNAGNQKIPNDLKDLRYGVSVTDGCIDWDTTASLLRELASSLKPVISARRHDKV
jgi:3-deoxy-7-phosphoheptulonate synthase